MIEEARYRVKMLNLIRRDKFDLILPGAMRDNDIDMWIHVIKRGHPDPMGLDLGANMGYFVFFDKGENRIERALFGVSFAEIADEEIFDLIGEEDELTRYVAVRNPRKIAVNMSTWLTHADGLSYTGHSKLCQLLGDEQAGKLVSAENVITDFRVRRVQSEIILFAKACEIQRVIMETAFQGIIPGRTTRADIGWYGKGRLLEQGLENHYYGIEPLPDVQYSHSSEPSEWEKADYVFQRGDFISWDWGFTYLNFGTDFKRKAYLLPEGEIGLPEGVQRAWDQAVAARGVLRSIIRSGKTAAEMLETVVSAIETAGYVYTPFTDTPRDKEIIQSLGDSNKIGFSIDCHCVGNTGNSEVAVGPSLAPFRKDRAHLKIQPNNLIAFEFAIHAWVPEWKKRLMLNLEDNALVTDRGIEALYPNRNEMIFVR